jgi:hypothetical protein
MNFMNICKFIFYMNYDTFINVRIFIKLYGLFNLMNLVKV